MLLLLLLPPTLWSHFLTPSASTIRVSSASSSAVQPKPLCAPIVPTFAA